MYALESIAPKLYVPGAPFLRSTVKSGAMSEDCMFSNQVFCFTGLIVFNDPNASPNNPSLAGSVVKLLETWVATSRACLGAEIPPMVTSSLTTVPEHAEPSPYWMDQVWSARTVEVVEDEGL